MAGRFPTISFRRSIPDIFVHPQYQKKGLGRLIMEKVKERYGHTNFFFGFELKPTPRTQPSIAATGQTNTKPNPKARNSQAAIHSSILINSAIRLQSAAVSHDVDSSCQQQSRLLELRRLVRLRTFLPSWGTVARIVSSFSTNSF